MAGRKRREPDLLSYADFRKYLRDYYAFRKSRDRRYSYGAFAKRAGIPARGHLKAVLDYGLRLTPDTLSKYRKTLGLTGHRGEYFAILVSLAQAGDEAQREAAQAALRRWRRDHVWVRAATPEAWEIFTRGPRLLVHCLRSFPGFREDPAWISRRLLGAVSPEEAREALDFLARWKPLKEGMLDDAAGSEVIDPYRRFLFKTAGRRANRRMGYGGDSTNYLVPLTRKQAVELNRKLEQWLKANIPDPVRDPETELCVVIGDVFAASGPV